MNRQEFIAQHLYKRSLISYLLFPLSLIYGFLQRFRRIIYSNSKYQFKSKIKVISIGNIVSGGSGKTTFTIYLARYLKARGMRVAVSLRGYKGAFESSVELISDRLRINKQAAVAGDEATLLSEKLSGIPVVVGKNRKKAIRLLEDRFPDLDYIILDDSFQHLKVFHDLDILVFHAIGGCGNGFILPAGILRESLSSISQADLVIYNGSHNIPDWLKNQKIPVLTGKYKTDSIRDLSGNRCNIDDLKNHNIALMSAIGLPDSFEQTVKESGITFKKHIRLPDHYHYEDLDKIEMILNSLEDEGINTVLITEKDEVKLRNRLSSDHGILVLKIKFALDLPDRLETFFT